LLIFSIDSRVRTFDLPDCTCQSLEELCDGRIIAAILEEMVPNYFDTQVLLTGSSGDNWALCASNISSLVRKLDEYYHEVLHKDVVDIAEIDTKAIGEYYLCFFLELGSPYRDWR